MLSDYKLHEDRLSSIIQVEDEVTPKVAEDIIYILTNVTMGVINSYFYDASTRNFVGIKPYKPYSGKFPNANDLVYIEETIISLRDNWMKINNVESMSINDFEELVKMQFDVDIDVVPIVNYLCLKEIISHNGDEIMFM